MTHSFDGDDPLLARIHSLIRSTPSGDGPVQLPVSWKLAPPSPSRSSRPPHDATNVRVFENGAPLLVSNAFFHSLAEWRPANDPASAVGTAVEWTLMSVELDNAGASSPQARGSFAI